jgi:hypothetical protein
MGVGMMPGFAPAINDTAGPISRIQQAYNEIYDLDYAPIIMQPTMFKAGAQQPIYYSLSYPTTVNFSPRSRADSSKLSDLYEIKSLLSKYLHDIRTLELNLDDTLMHDLPNIVEFDFFHTETKTYRGIHSSSDLPIGDPLFTKTAYGSNKPFPVNGIFVNGCIRLKDKS